METLDSMVLVPNDSENKKDMAKFVASAFSRRVAAGTLSKATLHAVTEEILEKSSGVFQFVRLACDLLVGVDSEAAIVAQLHNFGTGIDGVYNDYFATIKQTVNTSAFRRVMTIVMAAKEPLTQDEVSALLNAEAWEVGQVLVEVHRILDVSNKHKIKFMHKSLADYLVNSSRCKNNEFLIDKSEGNKQIAVECLRMMLCHSGTIQNKYEALSGLAVSVQADVAVHYCFKHWDAHLAGIDKHTVLGWPEWKEFCQPEHYGSHLIWHAIAQKKEQLVELAFVNGNGEMLLSAVRELKVFPSTPLYEAGKLGLTEACRALIELGKEDVNCCGYSTGDRKQFGERNKTVLMAAATGNHAATVKLLLSKGADSTLIDDIGNAAAIYGCKMIIQNWTESQETSILKFFSEQHSPDELMSWFDSGTFLLFRIKKPIDTQDAMKQTPLLIASKHGQLANAKWLVEHGANVNAEANDKMTPLHVASDKGHVEVVKLLVEQGAKVNAEENGKATPLHYASHNGHLTVVKWLVEHDAKVNAADKQKTTPLHFASDKGQFEVVKFLVEHGANVNAEADDKRTPLHTASNNGHLEVVLWLVEHGANMIAEDKNKATPLHYSCESGHLEVVQWLVENGANMNTEDKNKWTAVQYASNNRQLEVANWLVEHGANANASDMHKWTALHYASNDGYLEVVKWLIEHGANVNAESRTMRTPLHFASHKGHLEVVKLLVEHGANVNAEEQHKGTPLHHASNNGHLEVVMWLVEHGANVNAKSGTMETPLCYASNNGHLGIVKWLIDH
ncbi:hypothetical protein HDU83_009235, partial [Entophlyctis luteolus]